ncbi:MAG: beta-propeller fold lactonase family protein, partial [Gaiellaceae bacterium]
MKHATILLALVATIAGALVSAQAAYSGDGHRNGKGEQLVFVQTNELNGNRIVVFERERNGSLEREASYPTGGRGGAAAPGTVSDLLASQDSLVYDAESSLLFAVNAGSDSVSVFRVSDERLRLVDVVPSGGDFPASIAVFGDLV